MVAMNMNPESTSAIAPVMTRDVITVETSFEDIRSPIPKKQRGDGYKENKQTEFINSLVGELLDECAKEMHSNFQCGECGKMFVEQASLMTHIESHHKPNENLCDECGMTFKDEEDLNKHLINYHIQDKASECVNSENTANKETVLESHHKNYHTEDDRIKTPAVIDDMNGQLESHANNEGECLSSK